MGLFDWEKMSKEFRDARIRYKKPCCCQICGKDVSVGDEYKFMFANTKEGNGSGNFMIGWCCNTPNAALHTGNRLHNGTETCTTGKGALS